MSSKYVGRHVCLICFKKELFSPFPHPAISLAENYLWALTLPLFFAAHISKPQEHPGPFHFQVYGFTQKKSLQAPVVSTGFSVNKKPFRSLIPLRLPGALQKANLRDGLCLGLDGCGGRGALPNLQELNSRP